MWAAPTLPSAPAWDTASSAVWATVTAIMFATDTTLASLIRPRLPGVAMPADAGFVVGEAMDLADLVALLAIAGAIGVAHLSARAAPVTSRRD